jgi:hypothetical protein
MSVFEWLFGLGRRLFLGELHLGEPDPRVPIVEELVSYCANHPDPMTPAWDRLGLSREAYILFLSSRALPKGYIPPRLQEVQ